MSDWLQILHKMEHEAAMVTEATDIGEGKSEGSDREEITMAPAHMSHHPSRRHDIASDLREYARHLQVNMKMRKRCQWRLESAIAALEDTDSDLGQYHLWTLGKPTTFDHKTEWKRNWGEEKVAFYKAKMDQTMTVWGQLEFERDQLLADKRLLHLENSHTFTDFIKLKRRSDPSVEEVEDMSWDLECPACKEEAEEAAARKAERKAWWMLPRISRRCKCPPKHCVVM